MNRRLCSLVVGLVLVAATGLGFGVPLGALADTSYSTCPTFVQFQNDVQAISGTGTIAFVAPDCVLSSSDAITTASGSNVTIRGNGLTLSGGTKIDASGSVTLTDSSISGSSEFGIDASGSVTLTDSSVSGSSVFGVGAEGNVTLTNSTVTGNDSSGVGAEGNVTLTNSTVTGNDSSGVDAIGSMTLTNSTVTGNNGIGVDAIGGVTMVATVLSGNEGNCTPTVVDHGYNLSSDGTCNFTATGSQNNVDPSDLDLGTLGDYGGPTATIPLLSGSVAIDAIPTGTVNTQTVCLDASGDAIVDPTTSDPILGDQRGITRPQGTGCDIGAYEQATTTTTAAGASAVDTDSSVTLTATVTSPAGVVNEGTVTFSATDAESNPVGTDVAGDVANGSASAGFDPTGLAPGDYNITASYHDASGLFPDSQDTNRLSITAGPPTDVTLDPGDTSATVGASVTETATVTDAAGYTVTDGTPVQWSITGLTSGTASVSTQDTTTTNGQATLTYTNTTAGVDTVGVVAGTDPNTASTSASVTWAAGTAASLTLSPGDTGATVGDSVTETATVKDQQGNLVTDGTTVTFSVIGSNPTSGTATTVDGQASFTYSGTLTGSDTLTATASGGSSPSANATVTWGVPASTTHASLTIVNPFSPQIDVLVQTGANGGMTIGVFTYVSSAVRLSQVQLSALVVSGSQATLYGQALANGTPVTFRLDATQGRVFGTVRLRLSNGYDSGNQSVLVRVTP